MRKEREDIFEKNSALEDAVGKLCKEKVYLQRQLAKAINAMTAQQKRMIERVNEMQSQATAAVNALQSQATASCPTDQDSQ